MELRSTTKPHIAVEIDMVAEVADPAILFFGTPKLLSSVHQDFSGQITSGHGPYLKGFGAASAVMLMFILGLWIYPALKEFFGR